MSDMTIPQPEQPGESLPVHWKRLAILFLVSQTISLFGTMLVQYAITWHIVLVSKSGVAQMVSILVAFVPTFLLSPFGGVWADRHDRRRLMAIADGGIALVTLALALMYQLGQDSLVVLFVALALRALGTAIHTPAVGAFVPQLVPPGELARFNGIQQSIQPVVMLVAPALAGLLLSVAPIQAIFFIDVATAAVAIFILLVFVKVPPHAGVGQAAARGYFHDLREGLRYVREHSFLTRFFLFCTAFFLMAGPAAFLTPLQVVRSYSGEVWGLAAIEIVFSVGMIAGGLVMTVWGGFRNRVHSMMAATLVFGFTTIAFGLQPWFWLYLVAMGICGVSMPLFNAPATVLLQEQVDPGYLGRVFGVMTMISSIVMPMGMLVYGPLADAMPIEWLLVATGIGLVLTGFALGLSKVLLTHGAPRPTAQAPTDGQAE